MLRAYRAALPALMGRRHVEKVMDKLQVRQPWWNHPVSFMLLVCITPLCHLLCWLYNVLRARFSPMVFQYVPIYVDVPHGVLEWILVLGDFVFGQFLLVGLLSFVLVPIIEVVIPSKIDWFLHDANIDQVNQLRVPELDNVSKKKKGRPEKDIYNWLLYFYVALQTFNMVFSLWMATGLPLGHIKFFTHSMSLGMTAAVSVSISHELFHKFLDPIDSFLGKWVLNTHMYNHFWIAHVFNHHKDVATPNDPATARRNQTLYSFWLQSSIGGYINAWKNELEIMERKGINFWQVNKNRMLKYLFLNMWTILTINMFFGWRIVLSFVIQCIVASFFIEAVNYMEHYGLLREKMEDSDRYGPVTHAHSWDAPFRLTSFVYLNILMHSDHHSYPTKEYNLLQMKDTSPKLPYTYSTMILLSMCPPLFFGCIHPILDAFVNQKRTEQRK